MRENKDKEMKTAGAGMNMRGAGIKMVNWVEKELGAQMGLRVWIRVGLETGSGMDIVQKTEKRKEKGH
jgi:hypothetical protein